MENNQREFSASWGRLLKGMSGGVIGLFAGVAIAGRAEAPFLILFPLLLLLALPFMVRGYVFSNGELIIKRLGWNTIFPLNDLQSVEMNPHAVKGSIRTFGNGGLFSFTGRYYCKNLGHYRAFVNDWNKLVVLRFEKSTIVVSPDDPDAFVEAVEMSVRSSPLSGGSAE